MTDRGVCTARRVWHVAVVTAGRRWGGVMALLLGLVSPGAAAAQAAGPPHALPAVFDDAASVSPGLVNTGESDVRHYALSPGRLDAVLGRFGQRAGVMVAANPMLTRDVHSQGLQGMHTVSEGLARLLAGTGLQAIREGPRAYRLAPAAATEDATVPMLRPVAVIGRQPSDPPAGYLAGALSLDAHGATPFAMPHSVSVMTRQQLDAQGLSDLESVLRQMPGIEVFLTDSERISFYARGYEIESLQYDGSLIAVPGSANGFFTQPDTAVLERVEVLRGAAGLMRGAGSPSGAINLVRKRPLAATAASAAATVGSWDTYRAEGDVSSPLNASGSLRGRLVAVRDRRGHFQRARQSDKQVLYGVLEADMTPDTQVHGGVEWSTLDTTGAWGNLPANRDGSPMDLPRDTYLGASWNRWNRANQQFFVGVTHALAEGWQLAANAHRITMRRRDGDNGYVQTLIARNATDPSLVDYQVSRCGEDRYTARQSSWDVRATGAWAWGARTHAVVLGVNGTRDHAQPVAGSCVTVRGLPSMQAHDPRQWNPHAIPEPVMPAFAGEYIKNTTRQHGVYGSVRWQLADALTAITGARLSWWQYAAHNPAASHRVDAHPTPYASMRYTPTPDWSLYASLADVFTPQQATDVAGRALAPITGRTLEVGVKRQFHAGRLYAGVAVFRMDQRGRALDDPAAPAPCLPYYPASACKVAGGHSRSQGVELSLVGRVQPGWVVSAGYTYNTTRYLHDTAANTGLSVRPSAPRHLLRLHTLYTLPGRQAQWTVGAGLTVQSAITSESGTAQARQGGYAVASASVGYRPSPRWSVQLNIDNLFDRVYYEKVREYGPGYYYGAPRSVMLTLRGQY